MTEMRLRIDPFAMNQHVWVGQWHHQGHELKGRSITDFVVSAAQDAAQRVVEDDGIIRLAAEDHMLESHRHAVNLTGRER